MDMDMDMELESLKGRGSAPDTPSPLDLVCVGFGASALSIAVALHERRALDKTVFLERQPEETWTPGSCSDSTSPASRGRLRTSFLNDLVTSENPRSKFTFMNYLHATDRLVVYANSSQLHPSREMYADYLRWCAASFQHQVSFGKQAKSISPVSVPARERDGPGPGPVRAWNVVFVDVATGRQDSIVANQVICAVGLQHYIPTSLSSLGPGLSPSSGPVVHAAESLPRIAAVLRATGGEARLAIVGDGQTAAELFDHLHGIRADHQVVWFTQDPVLRATDDTPFVADKTARPTSKMGQTLPVELRRRAIGEGLGLATVPEPQSAIDRQLVASIYEIQYGQSVKQADANQWRFQIKLQHRLVGAERTANGQVRLWFQQPESKDQDQDQDQNEGRRNVFDLVIAATGYARSEYKKLTQPLVASGLLDGAQITVDRDYQVNFRSGTCAAGCGLWLQGALEGDDTDDNLYPVLAARSSRVVDSILSQRSDRLNSDATAIPAEERVARL
ncbi:hypothetical protein A1O3_04641 [Capronia epimyces CBS 606.96]|uniref:L-ornithine N(5)-monooxygenase n=1 Tax=Capronia epimyces CBS 606.96 TaxID=1182542 RepID=W9YNY3_9EURO|nr:uncharacterized protein A1O3_04641 [Capronia epimyces CBS 606.96]EXJ83974.1 hypothetical protein A1O3_04641 [Capronia epimyces CBS 606.96]